MLLNQLKIDNYFPLTYKDIMPILNGSMIITSFWGLIIVVLIFSDKIINMDKIIKMGIKTSLFLGLVTLSAILIPLGLFGSEFLTNISLPYFVSITQISLFDFLERIEASVISIWVFTDFILVSVFVYSGLYILKKVFSLSQIRPYIHIYMVIVIILSLLIVKQIFEITDFAEHICVPVNLFMGYFIPIVIFIIGKIRKKI
jgi:hypothetical protein